MSHSFQKYVCEKKLEEAHLIVQSSSARLSEILTPQSQLTLTLSKQFRHSQPKEKRTITMQRQGNNRKYSRYRHIKTHLLVSLRYTCTVHTDTVKKQVVQSLTMKQ